MDVKVNIGSLTRAIADCEISTFIDELAEWIRQQATVLVNGIVDDSPMPQKTNEVENALAETLRELGRQLIQCVFLHMDRTVEKGSSSVRLA